MEVLLTPIPRPRFMATPLRVDLRATGAWTLGLAPVLYLALRGGGYDPVVYGEVGLITWWIVLLGTLVGVFSLRRIGRLGWTSIALLTLFVVWTGIAVAWSSSAERTVAELGRVAAYLGFLVLGLCVLRRDAIRHVVAGMAMAFGVVSLLAVLSRLYPGSFPADQLLPFFPHSYERLDYPFNYSDGTANFLAMGIPLLLMAATQSRSLANQAVAAAAIPVAVLGVVLTASRGGVLTASIGILAFYALAPDRLSKVCTGLTAAAGSAVLVVSLLHRKALRGGLSTPLAISQRHQLVVLLVVACCGVALAQLAIGLVSRYAIRPPALRASRRAATLATVGGLLVLAVVAVAARIPGKLSHQWQVFKQSDATGVVSSNIYSRLGTLSGSHRYQYWRSAFHAFESKPLTGIGPGTFQFYWNQHAPFYEYIRNAHSLYMETLAETGLVGFGLVVGLLVLLLGAGIVYALRAPPRTRGALAGATAAMAAFCAAAGYDWVWQLAAIPAAALLLGAAILSQRKTQPWWARRPRRSPRWALRLTVGLLAIAAIIAVAIPFAATSAIRASQNDVQNGDVTAALNEAATAQNLEPYAATPRLQRALILEQTGDLPGARVAIAEATSRQPTDWSLWLIRARIAAESGDVAAAVSYYRRAHALDPLSPETSIRG
jgi:O-antigen ligase